MVFSKDSRLTLNLVCTGHDGQATTICSKDQTIRVTSRPTRQKQYCTSHIFIPSETAGWDEPIIIESLFLGLAA